jgi:hypothetical protein
MAGITLIPAVVKHVFFETTLEKETAFGGNIE